MALTKKKITKKKLTKKKPVCIIEEAREPPKVAAHPLTYKPKFVLMVKAGAGVADIHSKLVGGKLYKRMPEDYQKRLMEAWLAKRAELGMTVPK